jgi:hypothetical protein
VYLRPFSLIFSDIVGAYLPRQVEKIEGIKNVLNIREFHSLPVAVVDA